MMNLRYYRGLPPSLSSLCSVPPLYASTATTHPSHAEDVRHINVLCSFFGSLVLSQITRAHVEEFKQRESKVSSITGHKTFAVFQHYNNPAEDDLQKVVAGAPPAMLQKGSR